MGYKNRLKDILDDKGIKYSWLADQVNVSRSTMTTLIQNKHITNVYIAMRIANILDMRVEDIFYEDDTTEE